MIVQERSSDRIDLYFIFQKNNFQFLNKSCCSHTSLFVFLASCGLDVDINTITIKQVT